MDFYIILYRLGWFSGLSISIYKKKKKKNGLPNFIPFFIRTINFWFWYRYGVGWFYIYTYKKNEIMYIYNKYMKYIYKIHIKIYTKKACIICYYYTIGQNNYFFF